MMVGDNTYPRSEAEASGNNSIRTTVSRMVRQPLNVEKDTKADCVLVSRHFYYFGSKAPLAPPGC